MFSYVAPEARVPQGQPLRPIRVPVDLAVAALDAEFAALYSVRTGRLLVGQIDCNRLIR